jgi:hypothetical protein
MKCLCWEDRLAGRLLAFDCVLSGGLMRTERCRTPLHGDAENNNVTNVHLTMPPNTKLVMLNNAK